MPAVKHCNVDNHATEKPSFTQPKKESCSNETSKRLGKPEECRGEAPTCNQEGQIIPSLEVLDDPI